METPQILPSPDQIDHMAGLLELPELKKGEQDKGQGLAFPDDTVHASFEDSWNITRPGVTAVRGNSLGSGYVRVNVTGEPYTGNPDVVPDSTWTFYVLPSDGTHEVQIRVPSTTNPFDKVLADPEQYQKSVLILENMARLQESWNTARNSRD